MGTQWAIVERHASSIKYAAPVAMVRGNLWFYAADDKHTTDEWSFQNLPLADCAAGLAQRKD